MSRLQFIAVGVIVWIVSSGIALWWPILPKVGPEPPLPELTRGLEQSEKQANEQYAHDTWLAAIRSRQASLAATAVTFDTETITFVVGVLTALTMLLALLSRYLIGPMIAKQIDKSIQDLDQRFCTRQDLIVALMTMDNEKALLQLSNIWKAENR